MAAVRRGADRGGPRNQLQRDDCPYSAYRVPDYGTTSADVRSTTGSDLIDHFQDGLELFASRLEPYFSQLLFSDFPNTYYFGCDYVRSARSNTRDRIGNSGVFLVFIANLAHRLRSA